jgi:signal transduction histidine kinase
MFTIRGKIIISSSTIFSLTLVLFAFWLYRSTRQAEYAKIDARLESLSEELQSEIEEELASGLFPDSMDLVAARIEGLPQYYLQIFDTTGNFIFKNQFLVHPSQSIRPQLDRIKPFIINLRVDSAAYRSLWSSVEVDEKYPYVLQVAVPLSEVNADLRQLKFMLMLNIPLAILVSALAILFITTLAFRPLSKMAETAKRISAANLDQRLIVPHVKDELYTLSITLNQMFERLESAFQTQRQFVADASHEIRSPLTIMNTELEYARKVTSDKEVIKSIDSCLEEIDRLDRMTVSLLLLARLDTDSITARHQNFRLDELIIEIVKNMAKVAEQKSIVIDIYIEDAIEISSDIDMIRQVLLNIIENAIKYTQSGGKVIFSLYSPAESSNMAEICIRDNGPGISDSDLKNIFKRFFRGENTGEEDSGSGLGLPITQKLLSALGGSIDLKSTIAKGTEVTIKLPLVQ